MSLNNVSLRAVNASDQPAARTVANALSLDNSVSVYGSGDHLRDPRLVTLAREALQYRRTQGVVLLLPTEDPERWRPGILSPRRLIVQLGEPLYASAGRTTESKEPVTADLIASLERSGAGPGSPDTSPT